MSYLKKLLANPNRNNFDEGMVIRYHHRIGTDIKKLGIRYNKDNKKLYARSKSNIETEHYYRGFIHWEKYGDKTPDIKMNADTVKKLKGGKWENDWFNFLK